MTAVVALAAPLRADELASIRDMIEAGCESYKCRLMNRGGVESHECRCPDYDSLVAITARLVASLTRRHENVAVRFRSVSERLDHVEWELNAKQNELDDARAEADAMEGRLRRLRYLASFAVDWVYDERACHFCSYADSIHEEHCPIRGLEDGDVS